MGTGGSRYGAGRPGWRRKCEYSLALDIRRLHAHGCLIAGAANGWRWSIDGEPCGSIGITAAVSHVRLAYMRTHEGGSPEPFHYDIAIERTPCHFGGSRVWFRCLWCGRRCAIIYGISRDSYFACRLCLRLGYASECEDRMGRLWRKMRKLEARLVDGELKPKWMRWKTFDRISASMDEIDDALDAEFFRRCAGFFARHGMAPDDALLSVCRPKSSSR